MPKNVKGGTFEIFELPFCCKISKIDGVNSKKSSNKMRNLSLTVPKKGKRLIVSIKVEKGTLLLWNGILSHVRGFGCVENEVLSTYGKSALMHKKWTDCVELTKKTSQCKIHLVTSASILLYLPATPFNCDVSGTAEFSNNHSENAQNFQIYGYSLRSISNTPFSSLDCLSFSSFSHLKFPIFTTAYIVFSSRKLIGN